jgi:ferredoxin
MLLGRKTGAHAVKIHVHAGCVKCGYCVKMEPSFFRLAGRSVNGLRTIQLDEKTYQAVKKAEHGCPKAVIDVKEQKNGGEHR